MMLLVDAGNSTIKWALYDAGCLQGGGRFGYRDQNLAALLDPAWGALPVPTRIVVASVAGDGVAAALGDWTRARWSVLPHYLQSSAMAAGVCNAYDVAQDLGVDRWAALVAAHHHYPGAVCIIDAGTAITLDLLAADGRHLGGVILPGIEMLKTVLLEDTARVLTACPSGPAGVTASSTAGGVHGGAVVMAVAAIERIIAAHAATQPEGMTRLLTGGDAGALLTLLAGQLQHDPELVLKGLAILAGEA